MPPIQEILGPLLGFLFTTGTIIFIAMTARLTEEREDLAPLRAPQGIGTVSPDPESPPPPGHPL